MKFPGNGRKQETPCGLQENELTWDEKPVHPFCCFSLLQIHAKLSCLQIQTAQRGSQYMLEMEIWSCDSDPIQKGQQIKQIKM